MKLAAIFMAGLMCTNVHAAKRSKPVKAPAVEHSIVVLNNSSNKVLFEKNPNRVRSMASMTKLMTAMVVLDQMPNPFKTISLKVPYMGKREYTVKELLNLLLVRSDNHAAEILSKNFHSNRNEFIQAMNAKALALGMMSAEFRDPSGLDNRNAATANDVAKMVLAAGQYPDIRQASSQPAVEVATGTGKRTRTVSINNTNKTILDEFGNIVVSKTGTTTSAGKCLGMLVEQQGQEYAVVIMGEPTKVHRDQEARNLLQNYLTPPTTQAILNDYSSRF